MNPSSDETKTRMRRVISGFVVFTICFILPGSRLTRDRGYLLRVETALIVCGGNGSRHLGYTGGFLANLSKLSTKSMEINNLSLECPVPHRAGYSSCFS